MKTYSELVAELKQQAHTMEQKHAIKILENYDEEMSNTIADVLSEVFTPRYHPNQTWHEEDGSHWSSFSLNSPNGQIHVEMSFSKITSNHYELDFATADKFGQYSTAIKNFSNNSMGLFNYIMGTVIHFMDINKTVQTLTIKEPNYDYGKRMQLYLKIVNSPSVKTIMAQHGYSALRNTILNTIDIVRR